MQQSTTECQTVRQKFLELIDRGRILGLSDEEICNSFENAGKSKSPSEQHPGVSRRYRLKVKQKLFSIKTLTCVIVGFLACRVYRATQGKSLTQLIYGSRCIYPANILLAMVGPLNSCDNCKDLTDVPTYLGEITVKELFARYAVTDVPVIMRGAAKNWSALTTFSYQYLKQLYEGRNSPLLNDIADCQFHKYSDFQSLPDLLNMSSERAAFKDGESWWYTGWTVCDPYVDAQLRRHFEIPRCVKALDSQKHMLWVFIGSAGQASPTHLDAVKLPS
ncbi:unnamed protein product, partial [Lymnaea stagnalis]